jgi:hypothetical protein
VWLKSSCLSTHQTDSFAAIFEGVPRGCSSGDSFSLVPQRSGKVEAKARGEWLLLKPENWRTRKQYLVLLIFLQLRVLL